MAAPDLRVTEQGPQSAWQRWFPWNPRTAPTLVVLVLANIVPLVLSWLESWQVGEIIMVFWLENVVIGLFNILRMALCRSRGANLGKLFIIPFFTVHYGMFTLVHGVFVYSLFFTGMNEVQSAEGNPFPGFGLDLIWFVIDQLHLGWALLALVLSHGFSLLWHYLLAGEYRRTPLGKLMVQPYGRVIVLHVTILFGGLVTQALGQPLLALIMLVVLKILVDAAAHMREHRLRPE